MCYFLSLFFWYIYIWFWARTLGVKYPEVHCNYQSLGESLMPDGEVDNFLTPCFCRMLFKDKHPSSSGRHYFFPHVGVCIFSPSLTFLILCKLLLFML
jgi:hypothetical protein